MCRRNRPTRHCSRRANIAQADLNRVVPPPHLPSAVAMGGRQDGDDDRCKGADQ